MLTMRQDQLDAFRQAAVQRFDDFSAPDFRQVRRHLRHFLEVKLPSGEQVYFRFYDPRMMRVFLPTCTPEEVTQFFGPVQIYLVEDEKPEKLYRFVNTGKGCERMMIALVDKDARWEPRWCQLNPNVSPKAIWITAG